MKPNKSILMTSAHAIFKMQDITFSEALILAWNLYYKNQMAYVMKANKLVKSVGLGYETVYFNELVFTDIVTPKTTQIYNPAIENYYGCGMHNND